MGRPKPSVIMGEFLDDDSRFEITRKSKKRQTETVSLDETNREKALKQQNARIKTFLAFKVGDVVRVTIYRNSDERYRKHETLHGEIIHITPWKFLTVRTKTPTRTINTTIEFNDYVISKIKMEVIKGGKGDVDIS